MTKLWDGPEIISTELATAPAGAGAAWPEPMPLTARIAPEPYPLDALPHTLRAAIDEVHGYIKSPVSLVAASALSALSLAGQGQCNVRRGDRLEGPVSLYLLSVADSGERKSTADSFFMSPIREFQREQREVAEPAVKAHESDMQAWEASVKGVQAAITKLASKGEHADEERQQLRRLHDSKPEAPRLCKMFYTDAGPEALGHDLAHRWPTGALISAEAGAVFGSHGMRGDAILRMLATLNSLWSGESLDTSRRTSESFSLEGVRLTVGLMVQDEALNDFFKQSGRLARGSGFLARFLLTWPESTQGRRLYEKPPTHWPALSAFHRRIRALLDAPLPWDERQTRIDPTAIALNAEAQAVWASFHDSVEVELGNGGEYRDLRDVASKTADNAARLAALFHLLDHGPQGEIGRETFEQGALLAAWHLHEARRFFGELALPQDQADAVRLDAWAVDYCQRNRTTCVPTREAQRTGPVRNADRLTAALNLLEELDRVQLRREGKKRSMWLNPALLGGQS